VISEIRSMALDLQRPLDGSAPPALTMAEIIPWTLLPSPGVDAALTIFCM
jgi:hypothetical protein